MANPPPTISVGTTTAKTIHTSACYWANALQFFHKNTGNFYAIFPLVNNPDIDTQHGITPYTAHDIANNPGAYMPSTLSYRNLTLRSQSLNSKLNLTMDVDAPPPAQPLSFNWLSMDPQIISSALPTERTVRNYMAVVYRSNNLMEREFTSLFRVIQLLKIYVLCMVTMYSGFWPTSQSVRPSDAKTLLVSRNVIIFSVTRVLSRYPKYFKGKSIYLCLVLYTTNQPIQICPSMVQWRFTA